MRVLVAVLLFLLAGAQARDANAFHTGSTFADPPGAGGAGRLFYVGAPLERGWDCTMCHTESAGTVGIVATVDPPVLLESFTYEVGQTYVFTVNMINEHRGLNAGLSNHNGLVVAATDNAGIYAGDFTGFDPNEFFNGNGAIASDLKEANITVWTFSWVAPDEPGVGTVTLWFGGVDGDGAGSGPTETRSDPFGDDVVMASIRLNEGGATANRREQTKSQRFAAHQPSQPRQPPLRSTLGFAALFAALAAAFVFLKGERR
jgi:hypothetical protein